MAKNLEAKLAKKAEKKQRKLERIEERIETKKMIKEDLEGTISKIAFYKDKLKDKTLNKKQKGFVKKEIKDLRSWKFELKHPVLSFVKMLGGAVIEAINEAAESEVNDFRNLSDREKAAVTFVALQTNIVGAKVAKDFIKYNKKTTLENGLKNTKDQGRDFSNY